MALSGRYINWLLLFIALVVGAVIVAQIYWIYHAYRFQEENLRHHVQVALDETAAYVENNYGCFETSNKILLDEREELVILRRSAEGIDSVNPDTIRQFSASFNSDSLVAQSLSSPFPLTAEILIKYHYTPVDSGSDFSLRNAHNLYNRIDIRDKDKIFTGTFPVTYFMGADFFQNYIDSILHLKLAQRNIHTECYFMLLDENKSEVLLKNYADTNVVSGLEPITAGLYTESYFFSPQKIYLWIPDRGRLLLGEMFVILTGSFVVLVLLGWVTTVMARTLLRQKKLSGMKNDFINNMTHEFKTPIANIALAIDTIENLNQISDRGSLQKYLSIIGSENYRLRENVEKILEISMMKSDEVNLKMEKIDLHALVGEVIESFDMMVESNGGSINLHLDKKLPAFKGDKTHLANVIYNLIDNAIKYNHRPPKITLSVTSDGGLLSISVTDNGIGIPRSELDHIFSRFYRVPTGDIHDVHGFGLGLSYVKTIVEAHGGTIRVKSKFGEGSAFLITLPHTENNNQDHTKSQLNGKSKHPIG